LTILVVKKKLWNGYVVRRLQKGRSSMHDCHKLKEAHREQKRVLPLNDNGNVSF
jgi:hypothetical protein